jgi:hypothetical protein
MNPRSSSDPRKPLALFSEWENLAVVTTPLRPSIARHARDPDASLFSGFTPRRQPQ